MTPLPTLLEMAEVMFREGFTRSEAYPLFRWRRNGWPDTNERAAFGVMDAYIRLETLKLAYVSGSR